MRPGRHAALLLLRAVLAHVPSYPGHDKDGCFSLEQSHTTSQAYYLKGSGGVEIHYEESSEPPFSIANGDLIDFDAVFKYRYDQSTFDLYVGCGGCVWTKDPFLVDPLPLKGHYGKGVLEPFTQTGYYSAFPDESDRVYNASNLSNCEAGHWTLRLKDYHNRTKGYETLIWSAVVGKGEEFDARELASFPVYVLRNHGSAWNGLGWTYWVLLPLTVVGLWMDAYIARKALGWKLLSPFDYQVVLNPRSWCCFIAVAAFLAAMLEIVVHACYAVSEVGDAAGFAAAFFGLGLAVNGMPLLVMCIVWWASVYQLNTQKTVLSHWAFGLLELASGISWFFFFGVGFYIGPSFVVVDALLRIREGVMPALKSKESYRQLRTNPAAVAEASTDEHVENTRVGLPLIFIPA